MTGAVKLAGFAATLAAAFGAASVAGGALGPVHNATPAKSSDDMAMGAEHGEAMTPQPVRGLAVSEGGLSLQLAGATAQPGRPFGLAFRIVGSDGQTVRDFDVEHTKRMHVIVVRRDMTNFQHLHPAEAQDGTWSVPVTLREPGNYRVFADFSVNGKAYTLADDVERPGHAA